MNTEVHDVLVKARALIADPQRWTTGELARDNNGRGVDPLATTACKWCLEGAVERASDGERRPAVSAYSMLVDLVPESCLAPHEFNDYTTHAAVLALFDRAIEATKP